MWICRESRVISHFMTSLFLLYFKFYLYGFNLLQLICKIIALSSLYGQLFFYCPIIYGFGCWNNQQNLQTVKYLNIKKQKNSKMQTEAELFQELDTVQNYITTLFDSFPKINTDPLTFSADTDLASVLEQNVQYGRKIIELSDKFTAKYRKDHFVDRKDVEEKIGLIFKLVCPQVYSASLDDMVSLILKRLEEGGMNNQGLQSRSSIGQQGFLNPNSRANSINQIYNFATKDSKVEFYRDEAEQNMMSDPLRVNNVISNKDLQKFMAKSKLSVQNARLPSETDLNEQVRRKRSMNKSKVSKKGKQPQQNSNFTAKNVLQIKTYFQQEESCIRKLFQKINKILASSLLLNPTKISQQNREYTKSVKQSEKDNIKDFVQANIENTKYNINKISDFIDLLQEHYQKKNKIESLAQGKFSTYIDQINKRQEVFSFAVSKLLQNLNNLRQVVEQSQFGQGQPDNEEIGALQIIEKLEQISQNFYDLYPSHSVLKDLKIHSSKSQVSFPYNQRQLQRIGFKHEGVQVGLGLTKNQRSVHKEMTESKRNMLQLFKTQARINQMIERFERSIKFKKNVEQKQIEKFVESIRDSFPRKSGNQFANLPNEALSYQQQLKRIVETNEKNQKQLTEDYNKKVKKYEKQIQDMEKTVEQIIYEHKKQQQKAQSNSRKISKKLDSEKEQMKKILTQKNNLERNVKEMSEDLLKLQREMKDQYDKYELAEKMLMSENKNLQIEVNKKDAENKRLEASVQMELKKMEEQREIYHQKIILLETQQQTNNEQYRQVKYELQEMIKQNSVLKKQVEELTELYEEKIRELEELIENIKELEDKLKMKSLQNIQLKQAVTIIEQKHNNNEKQKNRLAKQNSKLEEKLKEKEGQAHKYREMGVLNESDIAILKQEMEKVKEAYIQSEEQLQYMKEYVQRVESEKQFILRENKNFRREVESYNEKLQSFQLNKQKLEKQVRQNYDDAHIKKKQLSHVSHELDESKREVARLKKQLSEIRQSNSKIEGELRLVRQQSHKKVETENLESGKRKLELETTKVELRRKTEQLEKMRQSYQQKIEVLTAKNQQLTQFITQKQLLAKITNSHLSH